MPSQYYVYDVSPGGIAASPPGSLFPGGNQLSGPFPTYAAALASEATLVSSVRKLVIAQIDTSFGYGAPTVGVVQTGPF